MITVEFSAMGGFQSKIRYAVLPDNVLIMQKDLYQKSAKSPDDEVVRNYPTDQGALIFAKALELIYGKENEQDLTPIEIVIGPDRLTIQKRNDGSIWAMAENAETGEGMQAQLLPLNVHRNPHRSEIFNPNSDKQ